ncbi:hypothetical protein [Bradyrhizobium mercantei]|uniref:hypothetical protein n=1 Tax=Bradyrhizobium mercantei TaxID=1904807 RepID=UPI0013563276|nr:hypothetical protein [Bradyrhizobium mercantei]
MLDVLEGALDSERCHLLSRPSGKRANELLRYCGICLQPSKNQCCRTVGGKQVHRHVRTVFGKVLNTARSEIVLRPKGASRHHIRRRIEPYDKAADILEAPSRNQFLSAPQSVMRFVKRFAAPRDNPGKSEVIRFARLQIML